jgi:hypothetical protein
MKTISKKRIIIVPVLVTGAGPASSKSDFELDPRYKKLTGIGLMTSNMTVGATMKTFNCDGNNDTFAEGFQLAFLQTTGAVDPNDRYYKLDLPADGKKLNITVTDPGGGTYPYTLNFHLVLEDRKEE